jgi:tetratricopeptide (TPR) repeat protein
VLGIRLAVELEQYLVAIEPEDAMRRFSRLLAKAERVSPELKAAALRVFGGTTQVSGERDAAEALYEQSLAAYERLGDEWGVTHLRHRLSTIAIEREDWERCSTLLEENLVRARALGSTFLEAEALGGLAWVRRHDGDLDAALELSRRHVALSRALGFGWFVVIGGGNLAECALEAGRLDEAERACQDALRFSRSMGDRRLTVWLLAVMAATTRRRGDGFRTGCFWGAAEAERNRAPVGGPTEEDLARLHKDAALEGDNSFEAGRREGLRLSLDEVIELAVGETETVQRATLDRTEPWPRGASASDSLARLVGAHASVVGWRGGSAEPDTEVAGHGRVYDGNCGVGRPRQVDPAGGGARRRVVGGANAALRRRAGGAAAAPLAGGALLL